MYKKQKTINEMKIFKVKNLIKNVKQDISIAIGSFSILKTLSISRKKKQKHNKIYISLFKTNDNVKTIIVMFTVLIYNGKERTRIIATCNQSLKCL